MEETRKMSFSITGELVTNLAREKLYREHDMEYAVDLIMSVTLTDQITDEERLGIAIGILDGKYSLKGTYPGDDYGLVENEGYEPLGIFKLLKGLSERVESLEKQLHREQQKISFICGTMDEYDLNSANKQYQEEFDEPLFPGMEEQPTGLLSPMVESYLTRMMRVVEGDGPDEDYGFIDPGGEFYPVEWAHHTEWANEYLQQHYPISQNMELYRKENGAVMSATDILVFKLGWVLMHNPYQGVAFPTYDAVKGFTKHQKETLYDYYMERDMHDAANKLYQED